MGKKTIQHKPPLEGFEADMNTLLKKFDVDNNIRFEAFSQIWRDMHFSCVYMLKEKQEMLVFTNEALKLIATYFLKEKRILFKVGVLYLLYGMYIKQPNEPKVRIRLTLGYFNELLDILKYAISDSHYDISYVFWNLYYDKAFLIFSHSTMMGTISQDFPIDDKPTKNEAALDQFLGTNALEKLSEIHDKYLALKSNQSCSQVDNMDMVNTSLIETTENDLKAFKQKHKASDFMFPSEEVNVIEEAETDSNDSSSGVFEDSRSLSIRRKQFTKSVQIAQSRRCRQDGQTDQEDQTLIACSHSQDNAQKERRKVEEIEIGELEMKLIEDGYMEKMPIDEVEDSE